MEKFLSVKPTQDYVIVVPVDMKNKKTEGGLYVVRDIEDVKNVKATVVSVSDGKNLKDSEEKIPMQVKVGDKVLISGNAGTNVRIEGTDCVVLREAEIYAVIED